MRVLIAGPGCAKCVTLAEHARVAARELGGDIEVEKITDINQIVALGIMMTPALIVDGAVKSVGRVLSVADIKKLLSE